MSGFAGRLVQLSSGETTRSKTEPRAPSVVPRTTNGALFSIVRMVSPRLTGTETLSHWLTLIGWISSWSSDESWIRRLCGTSDRRSVIGGSLFIDSREILQPKSNALKNISCQTPLLGCGGGTTTITRPSLNACDKTAQPAASIASGLRIMTASNPRNRWVLIAVGSINSVSIPPSLVGRSARSTHAPTPTSDRPASSPPTVSVRSMIPICIVFVVGAIVNRELSAG